MNVRSEIYDSNKGVVKLTNGQTMKIQSVLIIQILIFAISCSPHERKQAESASNVQLTENEIKVFTKVVEDLAIENDDGSIVSLKGFTPSASIGALEQKIDGEENKTTPSQLKETLMSENSIFEFEPPESFESVFSPPVPVTAASLTLVDTGGICENLVYQENPPSFKEIVAFAKEASICGPISIYFCIRLSRSSKLDSNQISRFSITPTMHIDIPCRENTFDNLSIGIVSDSGVVNSKSVSVDYSADKTVSDIYLTNDPTCDSGGTWKYLDKMAFDWTLLDSTVSEDGKYQIFAKFKDVFDQESICLSAQVSYHVPSEETVTTENNQAPSATSITIGGSASTNDSTPDLTLAATGASEMYITNTAGCSANGTWESYGVAKASWALAQSNAVATVYVKYRDAAFNESACISDTIVHDDQVPSSTSLTIDGGANTNDETPDLTLAATDATEMYITNTAGCSANGNWEAYATSKAAWTLAQTNATATVYVKFRDAASNESACISDTIVHDDQAPSSTSLTIDGGASTNDETPDLTLAATDATEMYITNTAGCSANGNWEAYATSKAAWTLAQTNATATVYVKFRDAASNESACISDTIVHDDQAPSSTSLTIDGGASTNDETPDLTLAATDATEMYITNTAGCSANGNWEAYATSKAAWILAQTNATATVYVKFRDAASNESACISDTIVHDDQVPSSTSLTIDGGANTNDETPDLTLAATDATEMYITNTVGCSANGNWEAYATSKAAWTLAQTNATATVYVKFRDAASNESACISDTIVHDDIGPGSPTISIAAGASVTQDTSPDLTLSAVGANQMYITNVSDCSSGGNWEAYATSKASWGLNPQNSTTNVYVKYRDTDGNESACVNDEIVHDNQAPSTISIKIGSNEETSDDTPPLTIGATGASEMYITNTAGCGSQGNWEAFATTKASWTLAQLNAIATVYIKFRDEAGNVSSCVNDSTSHDNTAPTGISIMIGSGDYTSISNPSVFPTATDANQMYITNTPGCASGGSWLAYSTSRGGWNLAQTNATATVYVAFRDSLENTSACVSDTIVHDNTIPSDPSALDDGVTTHSSANSPTISWAASADAGSGISEYEISIGTSSGATDTKDWTSVGDVTTASFNDLSLTWGSSYFANIRALDNATNESGIVSSDSFLFGFLEQAYIKASNAQANDYFGISVAIDGDTLVVGAYGEDSNQTTITNGSAASSDNSASLAGAVYVYKRTGSTWSEEAYIKASNAEAGDRFGDSVAIDGDTLVVGAYEEDSNQTTITNGSAASSDNSASVAGAVYVYKRTGSTWSEEAYIKASNAEANDCFGRSVAIDGDTLVVGAYWEDSNQTTVTNGSAASADNSANAAGAVYVYKRTGSTWSEEAYIKASNAEANDWFGRSVAIDGDTLVVGAYREDSNQTTVTNGSAASADNSANAAGAVYVYKRTGSTWSEEAYIKASNAEVDDYFGISVAIDGDTLVVGAHGEDSSQTTITNGTGSSADNTANQAGAVYVYKRTGSTWAQEASIKASNAEAGDYFGRSVAISGDTLVVGAYSEDSSQTTITNGTGSSADNTANQAGAVYVYKRTGSAWAQEAYIKASNAEASDWFGHSVAIDGDTLVVGADQEGSNQTTITNGSAASSDNSASEAGAVYVIDR